MAAYGPGSYGSMLIAPSCEDPVAGRDASCAARGCAMRGVEVGLVAAERAADVAVGEALGAAAAADCGNGLEAGAADVSETLGVVFGRSPISLVRASSAAAACASVSMPVATTETRITPSSVSSK